METQNTPPEALISEAIKSIELGKKSPRESLDELANTGLFLFHGTDLTGIDELEPRQADNDGRPDGPPAVFATTNPDMAIMMSLFKAATDQLPSNGKSRATWHSTGPKNMRFLISDQISDYFNENPATTGEVYVLNKSDFVKEDKRGYVSTAPVSPISAIAVGLDDLPEGIEVHSTDNWPELRKD